MRHIEGGPSEPHGGGEQEVSAEERLPGFNEEIEKLRKELRELDPSRSILNERYKDGTLSDKDRAAYRDKSERLSEIWKMREKIRFELLSGKIIKSVEVDNYEVVLTIEGGVKLTIHHVDHGADTGEQFANTGFESFEE